MKHILTIITFFIFTLTVNATICDFWWYEIKDNNVYWITTCDEDSSTIIPFIDHNSFIIDKNDKNLSSDAYYYFNKNYVISQINWSDFVALNKNIYTDRKNIFIKTEDMYLYISKYKFDTKIFTIYESDNSSRYLLRVNWELYSINISNWYISYNWWIHKINNIKNLDNFIQINSFIYTDELNFYSSFLNNKVSKWFHSGFSLDTADFFTSNNKQLFKLNKMWKNIIQLNYSEQDKIKFERIYNKLKLTKNPYIDENEYQKYWEFFIKKELLLHYLWIIINK